MQLDKDDAIQTVFDRYPFPGESLIVGSPREEITAWLADVLVFFQGSEYEIIRIGARDHAISMMVSYYKNAGIRKTNAAVEVLDWLKLTKDIPRILRHFNEWTFAMEER